MKTVNLTFAQCKQLLDNSSEIYLLVSQWFDGNVSALSDFNMRYMRSRLVHRAIRELGHIDPIKYWIDHVPRVSVPVYGIENRVAEISQQWEDTSSLFPAESESAVYTRQQVETLILAARTLGPDIGADRADFEDREWAQAVLTMFENGVGLSLLVKSN